VYVFISVRTLCLISITAFFYSKPPPKPIIMGRYVLPSEQNHQKAVCRSVFLTIWYWYFKCRLTKTHSLWLFFWWFCRLDICRHQ